MSKKTNTHEEVQMYICTHLEDSRSDQDTDSRVIRMFGQVRGARGFTEDEAIKVLQWADKIEKQYAYLELVKKGLIAPDIRSDGEVTLWPIPHLTQQSDQSTEEKDRK